MKFKDFQAPVLFSSTFKALNLAQKIKYFQGCVGTLTTTTTTKGAVQIGRRQCNNDHDDDDHNQDNDDVSQSAVNCSATFQFVKEVY